MTKTVRSQSVGMNGGHAIWETRRRYGTQARNRTLQTISPTLCPAHLVWWTSTSRAVIVTPAGSCVACPLSATKPTCMCLAYLLLWGAFWPPQTRHYENRSASVEKCHGKGERRSGTSPCRGPAWKVSCRASIACSLQVLVYILARPVEEWTVVTALGWAWPSSRVTDSCHGKSSSPASHRMECLGG